MSVLNHSDCWSDLATRWQRARRSAAEQVVGPAKSTASDAEVIQCAVEVDEVGLHRRLFENGVRLGEGFRRFHRATVSLSQLPEALEAANTPCARGEFELTSDGRALRLTRAPCASACRATCDAWREALDGLVAGLVPNGRLTRVSSATRGGEQCVDVFTDDPESALRWGEIPASLQPELESVRRFVRMFKGADVRFLGLSEGVLLYQLDSTACGDLRGNAEAVVQQTLERKLPGLAARELSPQSPMNREDHRDERRED
ncbi:MAG: hypothetical protein JNM17_15670 [Archangium sp.]|nr:hypothetical protein [Archangium sp.]